MYVLGLSCYYHDSSAALLRDGKVVAACEQERFTRKKHDTSFPYDAAMYCLESQGITIDDVDYVGFYEKPLLKFERVLYQHIDGYPKSMLTFFSSMPSWMNEKLRVPATVKKRLGYKGDIVFVDHHLAHAASCFLPSPFERAAIVTVDGVGEWTTTSYGLGEGTDIKLDKQIRFPHSIGLLYSTITAYLGFSVNNSEYKVMGLSAYGETDREKNEYYDRMRQVIDIKEDGSFRLDMRYFRFHYANRMPSARLCELLGGPVRRGESELTKRHRDISAALQLVTEDALEKLLCHVHSQYDTDNLVMAGGVALNSVFNGKIIRRTPFKDVWIQPAAGDGGTSLGVGKYVHHRVAGKSDRVVQEDAFLGPEYGNDDIERFLRGEGIAYETLGSDEKVVAMTAKLINEDNVIGWFQGRMEWGPRALGSRSILSNPVNPDMQHILNLKVKHREKFRPFAPVVCADDADTYFECDDPVPAPTDYMLMVYPIREKWREKLPAVTHVDGSGRLQTIRRPQNPRYYDVIKEFGRLSGIPILINTSFNIRGEPIVCTPHDAYRCMMGTGIDYLVIGDYIVKREDNPGDMWDSESIAKD